jgi:hypothetical protein
MTDAELLDYQLNYASAPIRQKILDEVRANFQGRIDTVIVMLDLDSTQQGNMPFGVNYPVQSCSIHNALCPRFGRLGNVWLTARNYLINGPSLHELAHGFNHYLAQNGTTNFIIPTTVGAHWGFSSAGGQLGGWDKSTLVSLGGGRYQAIGPQRPPAYAQPTGFGVFANGGNTVPYGNLELWTMGLIPDNELTAVDVAENAANFDGTNFTATAMRTYAPSEIVLRALPGGRPSVNTPRAFRGLVVLATNRPAIDTTTIAKLNSDIEQFSMRASQTLSPTYNFWTATGMRASLHLSNASELKP